MSDEQARSAQAGALKRPMARIELAPEVLQYFNRFFGHMADFEITDTAERR